MSKVSLMPDDIIKLIRDKGNRFCPVCSQEHWEFGGLHGIPQPDDQGTIQLNSQFTGYSVIICKNCAYTRFFSMRKIIELLGRSQ